MVESLVSAARMELQRPDQLNPGPPTVPRPAASVIVLRPGDDGMEVLLVRRNPAARFVGGAWVFPGGALDPGDGEGEASYRAAAARELEEEAGLRLPNPGAMVKFSRWITPPQFMIRFDTHFFLAAAPPGQQARVDGQELVDLAWHTPAAALAAHRREQLSLVFPTYKQLEQLSGFATVAALMEWAAGREVVTLEPQLQITGETARVVLPDESAR
jgi:8-oxo-dGTP pyrophosphatase MutT (NUDIX family)